MHARNFTTNVPKILDLKSSSEQIFFRKLSLGAPECYYINTRNMKKKSHTLLDISHLGDARYKTVPHSF